MHIDVIALVTIQLMTFLSQVFGDGTMRKLFRKPKASQIYQIVAVWRYHVSVDHACHWHMALSLEVLDFHLSFQMFHRSYPC